MKEGKIKQQQNYNSVYLSLCVCFFIYFILFIYLFIYYLPDVKTKYSEPNGHRHSLTGDQFQ